MKKRGWNLRRKTAILDFGSARRDGFDQGVATAACSGLRGYELGRRSSLERGREMAHEIAKLLLEKAGTFLERTEAIKVALQMGMPLHEIQEYLDWLDSVRPLRTDAKDQEPGDREEQG